MAVTILIMGLSTSGKTTLARSLVSLFNDIGKNVEWFNADDIRKKYNDWDFSEEGRLRQCDRMIELCNTSKADYIICDFIAPLKKIRDKFKPDYLIWMDTIKESKYKNTDIIFEPPTHCDIRVSTKNSEKWATTIFHKIII